MGKINYEDKVFLNKLSDIDEVNKVTDDNMNEIKRVVNENDDNIGDLPSLNTTNKSSLVSAVNEVNKPTSNILWEGEFFMKASQSLTLSQTISSQRNGIILHWQGYKDGSLQSYNHSYHFIPKTHVAKYSGQGIEMMGSDGEFGSVWSKYVYVTNTKITGSNYNEQTGTGSSGIKYANNSMVLTQVIGI